MITFLKVVLQLISLILVSHMILSSTWIGYIALEQREIKSDVALPKYYGPSAIADRCSNANPPLPLTSTFTLNDKQFFFDNGH